jgi:hypothetical protein
VLFGVDTVRTSGGRQRDSSEDGSEATNYAANLVLVHAIVWTVAAAILVIRLRRREG